MNGKNFQLSFEESKNGETTCSIFGKYLHSKYNPLIEGERFASSIQADFSPLCIFVLEPALSYCAKPLKARFPKAKICAIRLLKDFTDKDKLWDYVFYFDSNSKVSFSEELFNFLGEENLISSLAFEWPASGQLFKEEFYLIWEEIKKALLKARDVIGTRAYFSKRWLKNSLIFSKYISHPITLNKENFPILIAASGPSLKTSITFIKKYRQNFILIALSSAFLPLTKNKIFPDLVISSDGGYWAKKHLNIPLTEKVNFAIEAEAALPKEILENQRVLALTYPDGLEKHILQALGIPYMESQRNGTVAGTALDFAWNISQEKIFLCGFDQCPSPEFQHTQPNALENDNAKNDYRLRPEESRITASRFNSAASLQIYRNWFISNSAFYSKRVYRLSDDYKYDFSLGEIKDINWNDYLSLNTEKKCTLSFTSSPIAYNKNERSEIIFKKLQNLSKTEEFYNEVFPLESLLIQREIYQEKREELKSNLQKKVTEFLNDCKKILGIKE